MSAAELLTEAMQSLHALECVLLIDPLANALEIAYLSDAKAAVAEALDGVR